MAHRRLDSGTSYHGVLRSVHHVYDTDAVRGIHLEPHAAHMPVGGGSTFAWTGAQRHLWSKLEPAERLCARETAEENGAVNETSGGASSLCDAVD
jgi:hypothetical protein